jgi:uncharacterized membrane protein YfcA
VIDGRGHGQAGGRLALGPTLVLLSAVVGCVDGIYGVGGGSILAPILTGTSTAGIPGAQ